ncbi:MAG: penicillin-binding transpeptidase domain-containing protein [Eubacteriales bacterium]|nr:penicillin-binding transpeptidase domain-containing protein [Eubacteriales bacterium]
MKRTKRKRTQRKQQILRNILAGAAGLLLIGFAVYGSRAVYIHFAWKTPEELLLEYMEHVSKGEYKEMYAMLDNETRRILSEEAFTSRNQGIYEGIEMTNLKAEILEDGSKGLNVKYASSFDTAAGEISFDNEAHFVKGSSGFQLVWTDSLIFPQLSSEDKVRVSVTQAERGKILDRNNLMLAGPGMASSVGIVPAKLENRSEAISQVSRLLDMEPEEIQSRLSASWVQENYFVPLKTVSKVSETDLMVLKPDEEILKEKERQDDLLSIPGVMITDVEIRSYPFGKAAGHLVGYVQNVTAEDLELHAGEGYTETSVIGRSGMEALFEEELRGQNGYSIYIEDANGSKKTELASVLVKHGKDVRLTIDAQLQRALYEQFETDRSCSAAMNPYTGEVLALVSTPSFDNNAFVMGLSDDQWERLNEDAAKPLYNRFRQVWCPGSTFKPVIAAIGLDSGAVNPLEDYGNEGLSWQKDASWGSYYVTTLKAYEPVTLANAIKYSDNIYFAKAALKIGAESLKNALLRLGFNEELPFDIVMSPSQFSNTDSIETEIQLADSGYGQGQVLVNPLHLAALYTAFCNEGDILSPKLMYEESPAPQVWIDQAFSKNAADTVLEALKQTINDADGTGYGAYRSDMVLAGKTGTAEIKESVEDDSGTELGWFAVFTAEKNQKKPLLLVTMTEDVKDIGGSGYVISKDSAAMNEYFRDMEALQLLD